MSSGAFYSAIYTCQSYHVMVKEKINILSYLILSVAKESWLQGWDTVAKETWLQGWDTVPKESWLQG